MMCRNPHTPYIIRIFIFSHRQDKNSYVGTCGHDVLDVQSLDKVSLFFFFFLNLRLYYFG